MWIYLCLLEYKNPLLEYVELILHHRPTWCTVTYFVVCMKSQFSDYVCRLTGFSWILYCTVAINDD